MTWGVMPLGWKRYTKYVKESGKLVIGNHVTYNASYGQLCLTRHHEQQLVVGYLNLNANVCVVLMVSCVVAG